MKTVEGASWKIQDLWNEVITEERVPKKRDYIRASDIGRPFLDRWYQMQGKPYTNPFDARILRVFDCGNIFETLVIERIFSLLGLLKRTQTEIKVEKKGLLPVIGHHDPRVGGKINVDISESQLTDEPEWLANRARAFRDAIIKKYPKGIKEVITEIKTVNCIAGGELVMTHKGLKKIEDIKKEDMLFSFNKDFSLSKNKVKEVYRSGLKEVYKLTTKTGKTIVTTSEHRVLTTNVKYLADRNIKSGNILWKRIKDIKSGNKIAVVNKYPEIYLKSIINTDIAFVLGLIIGDGYINKNFYCRLVVNTIDEANLVKKIIDDHYGLNCQIKPLNKIFKIDLTGGVENKKGRGNHSNKFVNFLRKHNINKTGTGKEVPKLILDSNNAIVASFLKGLFQADGYCSKHNHSITISYSSISKKLAKQVSHLLLRLGIQNSLYEENHKNSGFYTKNSKIYSINIRSFSFSNFYNKIGFVLLKKEKLTKLMNQWEQKSRNRKENVFFDIVKKIESLGKKQTYDIEMCTTNDEFNNSFCCEDVVVHNSRAFWAHKNIDPVTGYFMGYPHHKLQLLTYLMGTDMPEGRLFYISKDDLSIMETPVFRDDKVLQKEWDLDIRTMSEYWQKKEKPPKEPNIIFNKDKGEYELNWKIGRSNYLKKITGFNSNDEWQAHYFAELKRKNRAKCKDCSKTFTLSTLNKYKGICGRCSKKKNGGEQKLI